MFLQRVYRDMDISSATHEKEVEWYSPFGGEMEVTNEVNLTLVRTRLLPLSFLCLSLCFCLSVTISKRRKGELYCKTVLVWFGKLLMKVCSE